MVTVREYISLNTAGDEEACRRLLRDAERVIPARFRPGNSKQVGGCFAAILYDDQDVENEMLEPMDVLECTNGAYPLVWFNLTFNPSKVSDDELAEIENALSLRLLSTSQSTSQMY